MRMQHPRAASLARTRRPISQVLIHILCLTLLLHLLDVMVVIVLRITIFALACLPRRG